MKTTNERITVHLDPATSEAKLRDVADELAIYFNISVEEAQNLLGADVILLERPQAEALVSICQHLGVRGTLNKKRLKSPLAARLSDNAVPLLLAVLSVVVVLAVGALMLPSLEPVETFVAENLDLEAPQPEAVEPETAEPEAAEPATPDLTAGSDVTIIPLPEIGSQRVEPATSAKPSNRVGEENSQANPSPPAETLDTPVLTTLTALNAVSAAPSSVERGPVRQAAAQGVIEPDLFTAARDLSANEVERLLALFPMLELHDAYGQTPLMYAAGSNSAEVVRALLDAGADVNARSKAGWTPLMYAARNRDATVTQVLLAAGADLSARNESGEVARDIALANNNPGTAGVLAIASREVAERQSRWTQLARSQTQQTQAQQPQTEQAQTGISAPFPAVQVSFAQPLPDAPATVTVGAERRDEQRRVLESCLNDWESCGSN